MTDKERIIIDGVDVSECEQITYKKSLNPMCGNTWFCCYGRENCYFKQLARKTAECKELQEKVDYSHNDNIRWSEAWLKMWRQRSRYRKALDEIEEYVQSQFDGFGNDVYAMDKVAINHILDIISKAKEEE